MLAKPGQREIQLISHEAGNRRPGDDGQSCSRAPEIDEDVTLADHGEAEVQAVAGDREQVAPHRQRGDVRDIVRAAPRVIVKVPPVSGRNSCRCHRRTSW